MLGKLIRKSLNFYQRLKEEDNPENRENEPQIVILGDIQLKCRKCHKSIFFRGSELTFKKVGQQLDENQERTAVLRAVCGCQNYVQVKVNTSNSAPASFESIGGLLEKKCDVYVN